jgi:hypothetical protein
MADAHARRTGRYPDATADQVPGIEQPQMTEEQILAWADAHRARTGEWPAKRGGPIEESEGGL